MRTFIPRILWPQDVLYEFDGKSIGLTENAMRYYELRDILRYVIDSNHVRFYYILARDVDKNVLTVKDVTNDVEETK